MLVYHWPHHSQTCHVFICAPTTNSWPRSSHEPRICDIVCTIWALTIYRRLGPSADELLQFPWRIWILCACLRKTIDVFIPSPTCGGVSDLSLQRACALLKHYWCVNYVRGIQLLDRGRERHKVVQLGATPTVAHASLSTPLRIMSAASRRNSKEAYFSQGGPPHPKTQFVWILKCIYFKIELLAF